MIGDVHASEIGNKLLKPVLLDIQHQAFLLAIVLVAEALSAQEYSELQRHIESGKLVFLVKLGSRKVVDAERALLDNPIELLDAGLTRVTHFPGTADTETTAYDGKHESLKPSREVFIKRAIYEDVRSELRRHLRI